MKGFQEMPELSDVEPHPLFPPTDEEDPDEPAPPIAEIVIQRIELGKRVTCPRMFRASEMMSLAELANTYGGGEYELIGRHNSRISARRKYVIPGKSKPMYDVEEEVPKPPTSTANGIPIPTNGEPSIMSVIMLMMNQQSQAADRTMQLMMAMMNNSSQTSAADKIAQQAAMDRQRESDRLHSESMMAMMRDLASAKSGNGSSDETFFRGVEFMRTFSTQQVQQAIEAAKANSDEGLEGLLGSVMQAIEGGMQLYKMSKEAGGVVPQVTQTPASEVVQ